MSGVKSTMKRRSQQLNCSNNAIASEQRKLEREWARLDKAFKHRNRQIVRYTHTLEDELAAYENEKIKNTRESKPYKESELLDKMDFAQSRTKKQKQTTDGFNTRPVSAVVCKARLALRKIDLARENLEKKKRIKEFVQTFHGIDPDKYIGSCSATTKGKTNLRRHSISSLPSTIISDKDLINNSKSHKSFANKDVSNDKDISKEKTNHKATNGIDVSIQDSEKQQDSKSVETYDRSYVSGFQINENDTNNNAFEVNAYDTKPQDQTLEDIFSITNDKEQDTLNMNNGKEPIGENDSMEESTKTTDHEMNATEKTGPTGQEIDDITKNTDALRMSDDLTSYNRGKQTHKILKRSNTIDAMDISRLCVNDDDLRDVNIIVDSAGHLPSKLNHELSASIDSLDTIEEKADDSKSRRPSVWSNGHDVKRHIKKTSVGFMKHVAMNIESKGESESNAFGDQIHPQTARNKWKSITSKIMNPTPNSTDTKTHSNGLTLPKLGLNRERRKSFAMFNRLASDMDEHSFEDDDTFRPLRIEAPKLKGIPYHTGERVGTRRTSIQLQHMLEDMRGHRPMAELIQMKNNEKSQI